MRRRFYLERFAVSQTAIKYKERRIPMLIPDEEIHYTYSAFPEELSKVSDQALKLMLAIKDLRQKYQDKEMLPLYHFNSDYENLQQMLFCIELELAKFVEPGTWSKQYHTYTPEELKEILSDKEALMDTGLDEWIEEGLL